ncbi:ABC transporter permease [Agilicoccus flavus]|uniref:ABC transporter permease n=1 Tax=Agilicoccus flavus TaxID=2775968 RepID=UPI001CF62E59|nr:ABC transporter permease [Agilicoccus flavus]
MNDTSTTDRPGPSPAGPPREQGATSPENRRGVLDVLARFQGVLVPIVALLVAFAIGAALIRLQGVNPAFAYTTLFRDALLTESGLLRTLQKATPLILSGLAVVIGLRVGLFNIGAQGQLLWGAIGAAYVGVHLAGAPAVVILPAALLAGIACGAVWAGIAGLLKAYRGVHEVISTIMLNSVAAGVIDWLVSFPLKEPGQSIPRSSAIDPAAELSNLGFVPVGFVVALALAGLIAWILRRTTAGFRFDTVGANRDAAHYAGIRIPLVVTAAMCASGALAGLGGAIETLGVVGRYETGSSAGLGFDGITIALLARANPLATIPAALLVGVLRSGAAGLQFETGIQPEVVDVLLAVTLLLVSIPVLARVLFGRRARDGVSLTSGWGS